MPSKPYARFCYGLLIVPIVPIATLLFASRGIAASEPAPTLQDLQLMARVIGFQDKPVSGSLRLCIVVDPNNAASRAMAQQVAALVGSGLHVGGIDLSTVTVPQDGVDRSTGFAALFATPGVDPARLRSALIGQHIPCLTMNRAQLGQGGCMVAVQSDPSVSITLDQRNAEAAGVRFATAFRMMVNEQ